MPKWMKNKEPAAISFLMWRTTCWSKMSTASKTKLLGKISIGGRNFWPRAWIACVRPASPAKISRKNPFAEGMN